MTVGPEIHPEAASQEAAHIRAMRGEHAPGFDANYILEARCVRLNSENIELRTRLDLMRTSKEAAQELLEAERQKNAALNDKLINAEDARTANSNSALEFIGRARELRRLLEVEQKKNIDLELTFDALKATAGNAVDLVSQKDVALDTERLLRTNDAATIADLERRLREAEGQLKAQRLSAAEVSEIRAYVPWATKKERARADAAAAENAEIVELRRTIDLMAKTAAEAQDNFRLIAELAADPADEKRKENTK